MKTIKIIIIIIIGVPYLCPSLPCNALESTYNYITTVQVHDLFQNALGILRVLGTLYPTALLWIRS
jgi:hypothetical protein